MKKGIESSDSIYKQELNIRSSEQLKLMEENRSLRDQLALKKKKKIKNLSTLPLPPMNNLTQKLPAWFNDDLRPFVHECGLEDKVMELNKSFSRENILEALQE